jgi:hypothetical protein
VNEGGFEYAVVLGNNFVKGNIFVDINECRYNRAV